MLEMLNASFNGALVRCCADLLAEGVQDAECNVPDVVV